MKYPLEYYLVRPLIIGHYVLLINRTHEIRHRYNCDCGDVIRFLSHVNYIPISKNLLGIIYEQGIEVDTLCFEG